MGTGDGHKRAAPILAIIVPCYNEEDALPSTAPALLSLIDDLARKELCNEHSFIVFVDDGSKDRTWQFLHDLATTSRPRVRAVRLATNSGHQNALLAGLEYATNRSDASISIDADLQDDLDAVEKMLIKYREGDEIVLGVRADRSSDSAFKRGTATWFYKIMKLMGVNATPQHADFRLMSKAAMRNLAMFPEYHVYLRGYPHILHSRVSQVHYSRSLRLAGETKYPLGKMLSLAWNGITSFSIVPLRLISILGLIVFIVAAALSIYAVIAWFRGHVVPGWASLTAPLYALGGLIMLSTGVVGEYVGKIYMEVKRRPRYLLDTVEPSDE